eukprot:gene28350-34227_t
MGATGSTVQSVNLKYTWKTTAEIIMQSFGHLAEGKHVIVTGGNCGLGYHTALKLAEAGAHVTLACRSAKLGEEAVERIKQEVSHADIRFMALDLSSFESVRAFSSAYRQKNLPLHVLVNNAGVMAGDRVLTQAGLEQQFAVNHLGHFLLTLLLLDVLKTSGSLANPARVVNLSSMGNYLFSPPEGIRLDDLAGSKHYDMFERYGSSKLANILFSKELNRRMLAEGGNVVSVALHPGAILETNLIRHFRSFHYLSSMISGLWKTRDGMAIAFWREPYKNTTQGTATTLYCALSPDIIPGEYYSNCTVEKRVIHAKASDVELAKKLWEVSVSLCGL